MKRQKEFTFTLPIGYRDEDGNLHREATLRKMTGREEEVLAEPMYANNGGKLVTQLLYNCLLRLGTLPNITREVVSNLYSPDRNFLLVKLRTITFGPELQANYTCSSCGTLNYVLEDLDSLPVKNWEDGEDVEIEVELEDGYEDKGVVHTHMVFRPPRGEDEEKIADIAKRNIVKGKNALLTRCLKKFGEMETYRFQGLGTIIFEELTLKDRRKIDESLEKNMPGIELSREIQCVGCGKTNRVDIDLENFLYPE